MIGSYKKVRPLSESQFVQVWVVEDPKTGKECVAKTISLKVMSEKLMIAEINDHKKLDHPNLLKTIDSFKDTSNECYVIVTEYCPGLFTCNFRW